MHIQTPKGTFILREATEEDLPQLVHVHVTSWNDTYAYYHPKPTPELRTRQWKEAFAKREDDWFCYVIKKDGGEIVGFATGNNFNDAKLPYKGQLNKIHFLKDYHRIGLGTALLKKVVEHFLAKGIDSMILFADPANPNILFYEKHGGQRIMDKEGVFHGAYGWGDIRYIN
jgi:ribosomal protein S18 acetylase RimI-like enzyme